MFFNAQALPLFQISRHELCTRYVRYQLQSNAGTDGQTTQKVHPWINWCNLLATSYDIKWVQQVVLSSWPCASCGSWPWNFGTSWFSPVALIEFMNVPLTNQNSTDEKATISALFPVTVLYHISCTSTSFITLATLQLTFDFGSIVINSNLHMGVDFMILHNWLRMSPDNDRKI